MPTASGQNPPDPGGARSFTIANAFFDTNVLVYSVDGRDPAKRQIARNLIADQVSANEATLSVQVLQEFFNACMRKLQLSPADSQALTTSYARDFIVVPLFEATVHEAMGLVSSHRLSYWDAAILVSANTARCPIVFTEDLQQGFSWKGSTIVNPFA